MSSSCVALGRSAAVRPRPSREFISQNCLGGAALAAVVLACCWTLYTNIFAASIYPVASRSDAPLVKRASAPLAREAAPQPRETVVRKIDVAAAEETTGSIPRATPGSLFDPASFDSSRIAFTPIAQISFTDRFGALAPPPATSAAPIGREVAERVPLPSPRPVEARQPPQTVAAREVAQTSKALIREASLTDKIFEKLFGKREATGPVLAYAAPDGGVLSDGQSANYGGSSRYDRQTAVYDISARTVYMPDGRKLEAHSGLGRKMDDPRFVHVRMHGATPPHVYDLTMREALFHGVEAIRMHPVGGAAAIHGRTGLLAHSYLLGPRGDSNGCVSFKDYDAFLNAFKRGEIKRLAVVAKVDT